MANCKFPAGIEHVSGTLSKKTIRTADGTITQRVFACMRNGKQRIYFREYGPRTTSLSEKEKQARSSFAHMAREVSRRMAAGDKRPKKVIWAEVKADFKKGENNASQIN